MYREKNRVSQFGPVIRFRSAIVPSVAQRFLCLGPVYDGNKTNIVPFCVRVPACLTQLRALRKPFSTLQLLCFLAIKSFRRPQFRVSRFFLSRHFYFYLSFFSLSSFSLSLLSLSLYFYLSLCLPISFCLPLCFYLYLFLCLLSFSEFFYVSYFLSGGRLSPNARPNTASFRENKTTVKQEQG